MAKIGLTNFRYSILTEGNDGTPSYNGAKTPAKAISFNADITTNEAVLRADDSDAESDYSFAYGNVTMGIDEDDQTMLSDLLGHTLSDGLMVSKTTDVAPYVGLGRIITKMVGGNYKYTVVFYYKVKFSEPSETDQTMGETIEFNTYEISGRISALKNDKWRERKTFDSKASAISYLEGLMASGSV